jgi:hypothetical protein
LLSGPKRSRNEAVEPYEEEEDRMEMTHLGANINKLRLPLMITVFWYAKSCSLLDRPATL